MSELASESGWIIVGSDLRPSTTLSCCPSHVHSTICWHDNVLVYAEK